MLTKELTKDQLKEAMLSGKCVATRRYGSSESNRMEGDSVVVTPQLGGRDMKDVTYGSFDEWYSKDILPYPDDEIEILL